MPGLQRKTLFTCICTIVVCLLVSSFALHIVSPDHEHPGHSHAQEHTADSAAELSQFMHGTDKKIFMVALLTFLLGGAILCSMVFIPFVLAFCGSRLRAWLSVSITPRTFDYHLRLLSVGILNTKVF